jgi:hypothetical protein
VRVLLVGEGEAADRLAAALAGADVSVERTPEPRPEKGAQEIKVIAKALLELEELLGEQELEAVLLASRSGTALAALLVATKLGTPTVAIEPVSERAPADINARLIGQLADTALAGDAKAIVAWLHAAYTSAP